MKAILTLYIGSVYFQERDCDLPDRSSTVSFELMCERRKRKVDGMKAGIVMDNSMILKDNAEYRIFFSCGSKVNEEIKNITEEDMEEFEKQILYHE